MYQHQGKITVKVPNRYGKIIAYETYFYFGPEKGIRNSAMYEVRRWVKQLTQKLLIQGMEHDE